MIPCLNFQGKMRYEDPVSMRPSTPLLIKESPAKKSVRRIVQQQRRVAGTNVALTKILYGRAPQYNRESEKLSLRTTAKSGDSISFYWYRIQKMFLQLGSLLRPNIPDGYMPSRSQSQSTKSISVCFACMPPTQTDSHPKKPQQYPRPQVIQNLQLVTLQVELRLELNLADLCVGVLLSGAQRTVLPVSRMKGIGCGGEPIPRVTQY